MLAAALSNEAVEPVKTISRRTASAYMDPNELIVVGVDTTDDAAHPLWDPRIRLPLDEAMIRNIQINGVIEPVIATREHNRAYVVNGRRRTLHAREASRRQVAAGLDAIRIPVIFKQGSELRLFGISQSANRFRVNDGQLVSARNAQRMLDLGAAVEDVAASFGVSDQTVRNWLQMLQLAPEILDAMESREIAATTALMLAPLDKHEQVQELKLIKDQAKETGKIPTVSAVRRRVATKLGRHATPTPKERINKAIDVLVRASSGPNTREAYLDALNKLSRVLSGRSYAKLALDEDE